MELNKLIIAKTREKVLKFLRHKMGLYSAHLYEDAVQQAFVDMLVSKQKVSFDCEQQFVKWMCTASFRNAVKMLKKDKKYFSLETAESTTYSDDDFEDFERQELFVWLKSKLPLKQLDVINHVLDGYQVKEIADILRIKPDTIKHRIATAQRSMKVLWEVDQKK
ncbi:MAG TPA: sigma-70 family RNA polymerase sigma factor [Candidatus Kapabacteria bacterium]